MNLLLYFILYIFLINIMSFFTMGLDKKNAINHNRRISEKTLITYAILLGSIGIYSGMYFFRHKTKHIKFTLGVPMIIVLNIFIVYFIVSNILVK